MAAATMGNGSPSHRLRRQTSLLNRRGTSYSSNRVTGVQTSQGKQIPGSNPNSAPAPKPLSTARKILKVILFPFQLLLTIVTTPGCAFVSACTGLGLGFMLGSGLILKPAYKNSGLKLAIAASILAIPAGILVGAGLSVIGLFVGLCDGARLPWDRGQSLLSRAKGVEKCIDDFCGVQRIPSDENIQTVSPDEDITVEASSICDSQETANRTYQDQLKQDTATTTQGME